MPIEIVTHGVFDSDIRTSFGFVISSMVDKDSRWDFEGDRTIYYYSITYVLDGRCRYTEPNGREFIFEPGDMFFCFPGIPHRFDPLPGEHFSEFWMSFAGPAFDLWRDLKIFSPERFRLRLEPIDEWLARFESLFANVRNDTYGQMILVSALQQLLLHAMSIQSESVMDDADLKWIAAAKACIDATLAAGGECDMAGVARSMSMSYPHFRRRFAAIAGMPPHRYHAVRVMEKACELMHTSHRTNRYIAELFGFSSESHFSKRFCQIVGKTPREYRTWIQQNPRLPYDHWTLESMTL